MNDRPDPEPPTCQLPGVDDTETRCWREFLDSSTGLVATLNAHLIDAHQLALFDVLLLDLLAKAECGSVRMSDLADPFVLMPSRVTQQIDRLESQGLVCRSASPGDRRVVLASITAEGRARLRPALRTYAREIRTHYLNQMSRQQMIALGDSCRRISPPPNTHDCRRSGARATEGRLLRQ